MSSRPPFVGCGILVPLYPWSSRCTHITSDLLRCCLRAAPSQPCISSPQWTSLTSLQVPSCFLTCSAVWVSCWCLAGVCGQLSCREGRLCHVVPRRRDTNVLHRILTQTPYRVSAVLDGPQIAALVLCALVGLGIPAYLASLVLSWRKTVSGMECVTRWQGG